MTSTNDGKHVKSNQISGPKGKSYYIELYKSLEAQLSGECELPVRTQYLCEAWRRVHSLCQQSAASTHPHLLSWLQRHTAKTVLQSEWQSPKSKSEHSSLETAINAFIQECQTTIQGRDGKFAPWESQLLQRAEWFKSVLSNPWGHPVLKALLDPRGDKPSDKQILEWLKEERGVMFVTRLRQLSASKCDDLALSLTTAVMDRVRASDTRSQEQSHTDDRDKPESQIQESSFAKPLRLEAGFTADVWDLLTDIEFVLLHKYDGDARCIQLAKQTPLRIGYPLVERLRTRLETSPKEKRLWKNAKDVATLIAQVIIARCMVVSVCAGACRAALYLCTRALARMLGARLPAAARSLAAPAVTARHLHTLATAAHVQCGHEMRPFVCELYVRAITAGTNELERLKLQPEKESETRSMESTLADWFMQLGTLLSASNRVRCECSLTAFSVHPSPAMYEHIREAPLLPVAPVSTDTQEPKEEAISEFGSWATDSRSQTNFVKTSETLNLKQKQNQTNVLSTAILTEGETLGLSAELCQDLAVLLSGPRVKTLSWDMKREDLLDNGRIYMERTHGGTKALTTELKYLNLDPKHYEHLPEEEDDENDMYYGIEKGYEHLVECQEPEEIWQDAFWQDDENDLERTETAYSSCTETEIGYKPRRKKKTKILPISSDEDCDPLSLVAEEKRKTEKKERPHSKERRKNKKCSSREFSVRKEQSRDRRKNRSHSMEKKEKKQRKKREKVDVPSKTGSLSSLLGMKVTVPSREEERIHKKDRRRSDKQHNPLSITDSDYDSQGKSSLNSDGNDPDVLFDGLFSMDEIKSPERTVPKDKDTFFNSNNEFSISNGKVAITDNKISSKVTVTREIAFPRVRPKTPMWNTLPSSDLMRSTSNSELDTNKKESEEVKKSIAKLINFRRQKSSMNEASVQKTAETDSKNLTNEHHTTKNITKLQPLIGTKVLKPAEVPKLYMDKKQIQQQTDSMNEADTVIGLLKNDGKLASQYSPKVNSNTSNETILLNKDISKRQPDAKQTTYEQQHINNSLRNLLHHKVTNMANDNQRRQPPQISHQPVHNTTQYKRPTVKPATNVTSHLKCFEDFLKELQESINAGTGKELSDHKTVKQSTDDKKKDNHTTVRHTPYIPSVKADLISPQCAKHIQTKKVENAPNTFARLSYMHKNKHTDSKPKQTFNSVIVHSTSQQPNDNLLQLDQGIKEHKVSKRELSWKQNPLPPTPRLDNSAQSKSKDVAQNVVRQYEKPPVNKTPPVLSNILQTNECYNKSMTKPNNLTQRHNVSDIQTKCQNKQATSISISTSNKSTLLSEKDQQDLLTLLRQKSKLNPPVSRAYTDLLSKIRKIETKSSVSISNSVSINVKSPSSEATTKPCATGVHTSLQHKGDLVQLPESNFTQIPDIKRNNVTIIGKTIHAKPIKKNTSVTVNSLTVEPNTIQDKSVCSDKDINKTVARKNTQKCGSSKSKHESKQEWRSVMDAILAHKTPSRGPNALDISYEKLCKESSLRNQRIVRAKPVGGTDLVVNTSVDVRHEQMTKPIKTWTSDINSSAKIQHHPKLGESEQNMPISSNHITKSADITKVMHNSIKAARSEQDQNIIVQSQVIKSVLSPSKIMHPRMIGSEQDIQDKVKQNQVIKTSIKSAKITYSHPNAKPEQEVKSGQSKIMNNSIDFTKLAYNNSNIVKPNQTPITSAKMTYSNPNAKPEQEVKGGQSKIINNSIDLTKLTYNNSNIVKPNQTPITSAKMTYSNPNAKPEQEVKGGQSKIINNSIDLTKLTYNNSNIVKPDQTPITSAKMTYSYSNTKPEQEVKGGQSKIMNNSIDFTKVSYNNSNIVKPDQNIKIRQSQDIKTPLEYNNPKVVKQNIPVSKVTKSLDCTKVAYNIPKIGSEVNITVRERTNKSTVKPKTMTPSVPIKQQQLQKSDVNPKNIAHNYSKTTRSEQNITFVQVINSTVDSIHNDLKNVKPEQNVQTRQNKIQKSNQAETKQLPFESHKKQFASKLQKGDDPFVSGLQNSEYDLIEELMDDDLRQEIGELSSDEEVYSPVTTALSKNKANLIWQRSSACNKSITTSREKSGNIPPNRTLNRQEHTKQTELPMSKIMNKPLKSYVENPTIRTTPEFRNVSEPKSICVSSNGSNVNKAMENTSSQISNITLQISKNVVNPKSNNESYLVDRNIINNNQISVNLPQVYIRPQQTALQNVLLIGSELLYEPYPTLQIQETQITTNLSGVTQNAYVAVNSMPNIAVFQSTQFAAPIVNPLIIGNSTTVPLNSVSKVISTYNNLQSMLKQSDLIEPRILSEDSINLKKHNHVNHKQSSQNEESIFKLHQYNGNTPFEDNNKKPGNIVISDVNLNMNNEQNKLTHSDLSVNQDKQHSCNHKSGSNSTVLENTTNLHHCSNIHRLHEDTKSVNKVIIDYSLNKNNERKVLSEVQEKLKISAPEMTDKSAINQKLTFENDMKKETLKEIERLKNKRLAIINREINYRTFYPPIPLTYIPLNNEAVNDSVKFNSTSNTMEDSMRHFNVIEKSQNLKSDEIIICKTSDSQNIKNKEMKNDHSKENKNSSCRRILLRSSNELKGIVIPSTINQKNVIGRKRKGRLKMSSDISKKPDDIDSVNQQEDINDKKTKKSVDSTRRVSKRIKNKEAKNMKGKQSVVHIKASHDKVNEETDSSKNIIVENNKGKQQNYINQMSNLKPEFIDVESELVGSMILKTKLPEKSDEHEIQTATLETKLPDIVTNDTETPIIKCDEIITTNNISCEISKQQDKKIFIDVTKLPSEQSFDALSSSENKIVVEKDVKSKEIPERNENKVNTDKDNNTKEILESKSNDLLQKPELVNSGKNDFICIRKKGEDTKITITTVRNKSKHIKNNIIGDNITKPPSDPLVDKDNCKDIAKINVDNSLITKNESRVSNLDLNKNTFVEHVSRNFNEMDKTVDINSMKFDETTKQIKQNKSNDDIRNSQNDVIIEEITTNNNIASGKRQLRVKLPHDTNKSFKVTVCSKSSNFDCDSLFSDRAFKSFLIRNSNSTSKYCLNIKHDPKKTDANKISEISVKEIIAHKPTPEPKPCAIEIVNLLSDDEKDDEFIFKTEFGYYAIKTLDRNIFQKHQDKFVQKCTVKVNKYEDKQNDLCGNRSQSSKNVKDTIASDDPICLSSDNAISGNDIHWPFVPCQRSNTVKISGTEIADNTLKGKIVEMEKAVECIEIDDSSDDESPQNKIKELKNLLLQDLSIAGKEIESQVDNALTGNINFLSVTNVMNTENKNDFEKNKSEIILNSKNSETNTNSAININCPLFFEKCDDLNRKYEEIKQNQCYINLVRCDHLLKATKNLVDTTSFASVEGETVERSENLFEAEDSPASPTGSFSILQDYTVSDSDEDLPTEQALEARMYPISSDSSCIRYSWEITELRNKVSNYSETEANSHSNIKQPPEVLQYECEWFITKSMLSNYLGLICVSKSTTHSSELESNERDCSLIEFNKTTEPIQTSKVPTLLQILTNFVNNSDFQCVKSRAHQQVKNSIESPLRKLKRKLIMSKENNVNIKIPKIDVTVSTEKEIQELPKISYTNCVAAYITSNVEEMHTNVNLEPNFEDIHMPKSPRPETANQNNSSDEVSSFYVFDTDTNEGHDETRNTHQHQKIENQTKSACELDQTDKQETTVFIGCSTDRKLTIVNTGIVSSENDLLLHTQTTNSKVNDEDCVKIKNNERDFRNIDQLLINQTDKIHAIDPDVTECELTVFTENINSRIITDDSNSNSEIKSGVIDNSSLSEIIETELLGADRHPVNRVDDMFSHKQTLDSTIFDERSLKYQKEAALQSEVVDQIKQTNFVKSTNKCEIFIEELTDFFKEEGNTVTDQGTRKADQRQNVYNDIHTIDEHCVNNKIKTNVLNIHKHVINKIDINDNGMDKEDDEINVAESVESSNSRGIIIDKDSLIDNIPDGNPDMLKYNGIVDKDIRNNFVGNKNEVQTLNINEPLINVNHIDATLALNKEIKTSDLIEPSHNCAVFEIVVSNKNTDETNRNILERDSKEYMNEPEVLGVHQQVKNKDQANNFTVEEKVKHRKLMIKDIDEEVSEEASNSILNVEAIHSYAMGVENSISQSIKNSNTSNGHTGNVLLECDTKNCDQRQINRNQTDNAFVISKEQNVYHPCESCSDSGMAMHVDDITISEEINMPLQEQTTIMNNDTIAVHSQMAHAPIVNEESREISDETGNSIEIQTHMLDEDSVKNDNNIEIRNNSRDSLTVIQTSGESNTEIIIQRNAITHVVSDENIDAHKQTPDKNMESNSLKKDCKRKEIRGVINQSDYDLVTDKESKLTKFTVENSCNSEVVVERDIPNDSINILTVKTINSELKCNILDENSVEDKKETDILKVEYQSLNETHTSDTVNKEDNGFKSTIISNEICNSSKLLEKDMVIEQNNEFKLAEIFNENGNSSKIFEKSTLIDAIYNEFTDSLVPVPKSTDAHHVNKSSILNSGATKAPEENIDTTESATIMLRMNTLEESGTEIYNIPNSGDENAKSPTLKCQPIVLKGIEYKDPVIGKCYVFPYVKAASLSRRNSYVSDSTEEVTVQILNDDEFPHESNVSEGFCEDFEINLPRATYTPKSLKRKLDMRDVKTNEKKYRKGKNIDYPKFTASSIKSSGFCKEFKHLFDYYSSIKFSYSQPFHKEHINVHKLIKDWPIQGPCNEESQGKIETDNNLFNDVENIQGLKCIEDPLRLSFPQEITAEYVEIKDSSNEINFNMGFGDGSGRVIQNLENRGDVSKFSAAALSDVKQSQPLLRSEECDDNNNENTVNLQKMYIDQIEKINRHITYLQIKKNVRSFFENTKVILNYENHKIKRRYGKYDTTKLLFDLCGTVYMIPPQPNCVVQVVQVGQLPVSAAAQNPVTCDPRVTQVSDASPPQCSVENSPNSDSQTTTRTQYTELTTADITLPIVQEYVQQSQMKIENQEVNVLMTDRNISIDVEIKSEEQGIKEELEIKEEENNRHETNELKSLSNTTINNIEFTYDTSSSNAALGTEPNGQMVNSIDIFNSTEQVNREQSNADTFLHEKDQSAEKLDQIAHAMNAAGISTTADTEESARVQTLVNALAQKLHQNSVNTSQTTSSTTYSKATSINAMALQQALAQILPPPLNQTNATENNRPNQNTPVTSQVLHILQGKNASGNQITLVDNTQQSVISTPNATQVLHIVQNKAGTSNTTSNGPSAAQSNPFNALSLVDAGLQRGGNQLLHIVNTGNQKNNTGQILKRVNLLTNLHGSNEQKVVQFVCKSADGKPINLNAPHHRSMVLRLQPIDSSNVQPIQPPPKSTESQDVNVSSNAINSVPLKENATAQQEIKSRSVFEENYAKFVQNSSPKSISEKSTSLPKFNQAFGKPVFQDENQKHNEINNDNSHLSSVNTNDENTHCPPSDNALNIDHMGQIGSPPLLLKKTAAQTSQSQPNLVQQIKQTITPMNIQTMHGGVIYTRQIPVNIGGGQTINLITVPSTELVEDSAQKHQSDVKFGNQSEIEPSIIKIVPQSQTASNSETSSEENSNHLNANNDNGHQAPPQPQPQVLTQMRIKLPMLSKAPQMVSGARVVRPSFLQIQRNVIGGANQSVYQQLVLTAAPPLGQQTIRLPQTPTQPQAPTQQQTQPLAQTQANRPVKVQPESQSSQSSSESQMSSSTLEQLREFDMVLEQVKERSTVQPNTTSNSTYNKMRTPSSDTTDSTISPNSSSTESSQQVLYSMGSNPSMNVPYVNRKTSTSTPTTFVRSPDSSGIADSPTSSSHIPHTVTSESSSNEQPAKPKKSKSRPKSSNHPNSMKLNNVPPKTSTQKPLEDEQTTQRILYILAEYKEQVENSPDKDKPAPRRRNNIPTNPANPMSTNNNNNTNGNTKRKKSSSGCRRSGRELSPMDDGCRTMGSEDSSCGTSQGDCTESCLDSHSPQDSPRKIVRRLTFEQESPVTQVRTIPHRNVIVADGQTITVARGTGKPTTAVLMPANYILPVSMVKSGQQIAIVTNRGPKLITVGGGEGGTTNALLLQRLIGPGLKPVLARPGVRHVRLPAAALHNLQTLNLTTATTVNPSERTASSTSAPTPPDLVDTRATSSPWTDRVSQDIKPDHCSSPEGSEPWNLVTSDPQDYSYEETVRTDNMDRTVLDPIPDRYSPDMEAQRIFDKMFDVDSKRSYVDSQDDSPRCGYDIDASDCDDKAYHQVVQRRDGATHRQHRLTHVSAAALRHKYAILEHELRLQKSLSEECEDLGVDSPSASELFPEADLLFATSPAHDHTQEHAHHSHTPQPTTLNQSSISEPDIDDQIATDHLLTRDQTDRSHLGLGLEDVGIVTVSEDGMRATIELDQEEFARSHPNTTFHREPSDEGMVQPFTITNIKGRHITSIYHSNSTPATVLMSAPQATVISQATTETSNVQNTIKYTDIDNMINSLPQHNNDINLSSVLVNKDEGLTRFDGVLTDSRELHLSNTASAIVHSTGNATQVIRRVCYEDDKRQRESRFIMEDPVHLIAGDNAKMIPEDSRDAGMEPMGRDMDDDRFSPERHAELFWESNSASERSESRRPLDFSSDSDKCCKSPYDETNSTDSSGVGTHMRLDSVIKEARGRERSGSADGSSDDMHPPIRTYPPKRSYHLEAEVERSLSGKTRAGELSPDISEVRRRASGRGVVKRGCHCCNGSPAPPRAKKPRQKKTNSDFTASTE